MVTVRLMVMIRVTDGVRVRFWILVRSRVTDGVRVSVRVRVRVSLR